MAASRQRTWSYRGLLGAIALSLVGALIGGSIVWVWQAGQFRLRPAGMSYSDLAAVLLTAVAVIVAIFGGVFALAAIWGFAQLKQEAVRAAREAGSDEIRDQILSGDLRLLIVAEAVQAAHAAGSNEIREQIATGDLRAYIVGEIDRLATAEFDSERMEDRIKHRVDTIAFGQPDADRLLDEDEGEA